MEIKMWKFVLYTIISMCVALMLLDVIGQISQQ
ncbi:hypothetical protein [Flyfo microvirus Tbat2_110]|nr:hypothetical protein [Flyfo microvirus Tbat2_110]